MNNLTCIDLIVSNSPNSFQNTSTYCIGLSDFHKLVVIVPERHLPENRYL